MTTSPQPATRVIMRAAAATERTGFAPLLALRPALGVGLALGIGVAVGSPATAATLGAGALTVGVASLVGRYRAPLLMLGVTCVGMGLTALVGCLTAHLVWLHILLIGVLGFGAGLSTALGPVPTVVTTQIVVGFIVLGRFPLGLTAAAHTGLLVAAGGAIQVVLVSTVRSRGRFRTERRATGRAYALLAELATAPDGPGTSLPAGEATDEATDTVARSWAGPGSTAREAFRELLVEARRLRTALVALAGARTRLEQLGQSSAAAEIAVFQGVAAESLAAVGTAISAGAELPVVALDVPADRSAASLDVDAAWWFARGRMAAIGGQLRAVARLTVPHDRHHTRGRPTPPAELRNALGVLRANLDPTSVTFRHAARLAVALPVGSVLVALIRSDRGYWVPLTTLVVLKPDFATTTSRGIARVVGTGAGVALATLVAAELHPRGAVVAVLVGVLAYGAYATFAANYALFAAGLGAVVVLLVGLVDPQPTHLALDRLLDTFVGGTIAFVAFLAWPAWAGRRVPALTATLLRAGGAYVRLTLDALARPEDVEVGALRRAGDAARRARTDLETTLQRVDAEPASRRGEPAVARAVVGACGRLVRTGHELAALSRPADPAGGGSEGGGSAGGRSAGGRSAGGRSAGGRSAGGRSAGGARPPADPALRALRPFGRDLEEATELLADATSSGTAPTGMTDLRAAYDRVATALADPGCDRDEAARRQVVLTAVDQLVDAVDLARDVLAGA